MSSKNFAIIGDGFGGRQVAKELAETHNVTVTLFCGSPHSFTLQELFGINTLLLFKKMSILNSDSRSIIGRWLRKRNFIPCNNRSRNDNYIKIRIK